MYMTPSLQGMHGVDLPRSCLILQETACSILYSPAAYFRLSCRVGSRFIIMLHSFGRAESRSSEKGRYDAKYEARAFTGIKR